MPKTRRTTVISRRASAKSKNHIKATKDPALIIVCKNMAIAAAQNKGKVPYGYVTNVIKEWS